MNLNIMKEETLQAVLEQTREIRAYTQIIADGVSVDSWAALQTFVKNGMGSKIAPTAAQLVMNDTGGTAWDLDVLGNDEDAAADANIRHVLSLQFHSIFIYGSIQFDPQQYLFAVTAESLAWLGIEGTELPAGTYHVTLDHGDYGNDTSEDGTYQFTTTKPVPIGGGIRHSTIGAYRSEYAKSAVLAGKFMTYGTERFATIESGLATTEGSEGTSLGTTTAREPARKVGDYTNFTDRQAYGSNRWLNSFMRQWLNSDESVMTFTPMTIWSRPASATLPSGFLSRIDPELKAVLCKVRTRYAKSVADGYGYEDVEDYVKLPTMLDLNFGNNSDVAEGPVNAAGAVTRTTPYSLYAGATNDDRIKYQGTTARYWWMASPLPWLGSNVRNVYPSGALRNNYASYALGACPSLYIG